MSEKKNTDIVAEYCAGFRYEDIPEDVIGHVKNVIFDTIGLMLGGVHLDKGRIGIAYAEAMGGGVDECTLVGTTRRVSAQAAAFGNGELSHTLDGDILMVPAHMTTYMMSAILAAAEKEHATGKEFLTAMTLGIDIAARAGLSQGGFRVESTPETEKLSRAEQMSILPSYGMGCLSFGGAVGVAHILGCDTDQMKDALGNAGFFLPEPSHQRFLFGPRAGMQKYSPAGWGNLVGIAAGTLAKMGAFGDREIFDGRHGFWAMQGTPKRLEEKLTEKLGELWYIRDVRYKYFPCDGIFQASCNLVDEIVTEHDILPEEIEHIHIHCEFVAEPFKNKIIEYNTDCPASFPYSVSCAAHRIPPGPQWHMEETRKNPSVLALMDKIDYEDNPACDEARRLDVEVEHLTMINRRPQTVDLTVKGGKVYTKSQEYMKFMSSGHPDYAPTGEQFEEKFRRNAAFTLAEEQTDAAIRALWDIEQCEDIAELMKKLVP